MIGPSRYDTECEVAAQWVQAEAIVLIVWGGSKGDGVACRVKPKHAKRLPELLRKLADMCEADLKRDQKQS